MKTRTRSRRSVTPAATAGGFSAEIRDRTALLRDGSPTGEFLGRELLRVADLADFLSATTPAELEERRDLAEDELRAHWYELGIAHADEREDIHS